MKYNLKILEGSAEQAYNVSLLIPEFDPPKYGLAEYLHRTSNHRSLILIAYHNSKPVGFKLGYERDKDGSFYSWMGGVLPEHREHQVAKKLANRQEQWARSQGYKMIKFKTRNRNKAMLIFAIKSGFNIINITAKEDVIDHRIWLEKKLQ